MSTAARSIQVGDTIAWDGDTWTVRAFTGSAVQLRSRGSRGFLTTSAADVVAAKEFQVVHSDTPALGFGGKPPHPLDEFPADAAAAARELATHLNTMLTGFPTGKAFPGQEPDPAYEGLALDVKCDALAMRLNVSKRHVYRLLQRFREHGVVGLVDERHLALTGGISNIPKPLIKAILKVLDDTRNASRITNVEIARRVRVELDRTGQPSGRMPPKRTFNRYLAAITAGMPRHLTQASQRNAAGRPTGTPPWLHVTRPMEVVMLDTTPLDSFAMNPMADEKDQAWQRVFLTLAIDVFSRSIVGWVFTGNEPKAEDIALLLYRIAAPKSMQPDWPARAMWRYPGAPEHVVFEAAHEVHVGGDVAGVPFGHVETFVVDHGKVYIAEATLAAAAVLGTNLQLARVRTPTDKPHVEAAFGRIREQFVMPLPGYKGPDLASRGISEHVEDAAFLFLWEIEDTFAEWVACDYQTTVHQGLTFQSCPELELTPNEVFDFGVTRSGLLPVPPPTELLIELLPTAWRTVQHYGIELNGVRYDSDDLADYRNRKSPWLAQKGKWRIKYDRSDRSRTWFWQIDLDSADTTIGRWVPLRYRGWNDAPVFGDEEVAYAKAIILGRGGDLRATDEFETTLDRVLRRVTEQQALPKSERQMAGRTYMRAAMASQRPASTDTAAVLPSVEPATNPRQAALRVVADDQAPEPLDPPGLLNGPDEVETYYFTDPDGDLDDLDGNENLAHEPDIADPDTPEPGEES